MQALARQDYYDDVAAFDDGNSGGPPAMSFGVSILCTPTTPVFAVAKLAIAAAQDLRERSFRHPENLYDLNVRILFYNSANPLVIQCYAHQTTPQIVASVNKALGIV